MLINNVTHERETLSERPIRQPLSWTWKADSVKHVSKDNIISDEYQSHLLLVGSTVKTQPRTYSESSDEDTETPAKVTKNCVIKLLFCFHVQRKDPIMYTRDSSFFKPI